MEIQQKLEILSGAARYDASCASSGSTRATPRGGIGNGAPGGVCHSYTPDGRCVSLLKVLLTNACVYDCSYCANRSSSDLPRARFKPAELADLTMAFYRRNYVEGLFLSSGVAPSPDRTMEDIVAVAKRLRVEHRFGGYIHLKAIPGASPALVSEAGRWCDRLSINIELPTQADLVRLAPQKDEARIEGGMRTIRAGVDASAADRRAPRFAPAGQTTQMVIGASPTPDSGILARASELYRRHQLRRVYYSAFSPTPAPDPRLPSGPAPLVREHRLYQADWLLRFYGFTPGEIAYGGDGNLDLELDPKLAWALQHRERFPVDVNAAPRELLLRVPGLGVRTVERIVDARRFRRLGAAELKRMRVTLGKAGPFLAYDGANPALRGLDRADLASRFRAAPRQLTLFQAAATARSGEL